MSNDASIPEITDGGQGWIRFLRRKSIWAAIAVIAVVATVTALVRSEDPQATPYRFAAVERGDITASVRATGTLNPLTTILVGSQLSGQVVEILADYNSPVVKGQIMARIFSDQIKTRCDAARADLQTAEADLAMRRAQLDKANASLIDVKAKRDRAVAEKADALRTLGRQKELTAKGAGAQTTLDQAQTQADIQTAALASAEAQIPLTQADIANAEAQVHSGEAIVAQRKAKLADIEIDLYRTDIRSPVNGVVVKKDVELGQTVAASLSAPTLFTVAQDLREIDIYASIDEADVGQVKEGQSVSFTVAAFPNRTFTGTVRMVRLGAETVQNVVTYTAVIGVKNTDLALLPGMTANLDIVIARKQNVLRIPNAALRFRPAVQPSGNMQSQRSRPGAQAAPARERSAEKPGTPGRVYVLNDKGEPQSIFLRLGISDGVMTEVLSGDVKEGMQLLTGGGPKADAAVQAAGPQRRGPRMF